MGCGVDLGESVGEGGKGAGGGVAAVAALQVDDGAVEVFGSWVDGGSRVLEDSQGVIGVVVGMGVGVGGVEGLAFGVFAG